MIFRRKIYDRLLTWKREVKGAKALIIEGARRIGKSTIVQEFAKQEYQSYILIDFSIESDELKSYFDIHIKNLDTLFMLLQAYYGEKLYTRESLIIFDEVQRFPRARQAIKHLVADGRYDYIETGSLISIREHVQDIVLPSEERHIKMYPLDFEEFAWALGEEPLIAYIKSCFDARIPLEDAMHKKAMLLFQQYLLVGGMPKVVSEFLKGAKSFELADNEKRDILELYRADIMKINARYRNKVLSIYDQLPGLLSRHERRIVFNDIVEGSHADQYEETFFWLADSMISNESFLCNDPQVGLSLNETRSYVKCYLADTGLLVSHTFDERELLSEQVYLNILSGKLGINKGMFYENAIAQMLVANGHKLYFYTHYNPEKKRNDIEIDFIISNQSKLSYKISPIEVKSSLRYRTISLERFVTRYANRIDTAYVIHPKNLSVRDRIVCIPAYMAMCL